MSSRVQGSEVRNLHLFMTHDTSGESATIVYCIQNSNAYLNDTTDCCTDILNNSTVVLVTFSSETGEFSNRYPGVRITAFVNLQ